MPFFSKHFFYKNTPALLLKKHPAQKNTPAQHPCYLAIA